MVWSWSDQGSIWSEKSDHRRIRAHLSLVINGSSAIGSDQKGFSPADSKGRSPSEEILINRRPQCFLWKAIKTHPLSQKYTLNGTLSKICSQQLSFVFFSNTFIVGFSFDELNTGNSFIKSVFMK